MRVIAFSKTTLGGLTTVLLALFSSTGCKAPHAERVEGRYLRLHITEGELGQIQFSRSEGPLDTPDCEMECEFPNKQTLRVPCVSQEIMIEKSTGPIVSTGNFNRQVLSPSVNAANPKSKHVLLGSYNPLKPHPGWISTFEATFETIELPIRFRIIFKDHSTPFSPVRMQTK